MNVCRIAPSPTGNLHVGVARVALFNYLFARSSGGKFLLRIEDTDRERSDEKYTKDILEGFKWLGIDWDDEPVRQSTRLDLYRKYLQKLLDEGKAYTEESEKGEGVRLKLPDKSRKYVFNDLILGRVERESYDCVIGKADGYPTYSFACVVDDHETGITHVIRGNDHVPNTAVQLSIYEALGFDPPAFAHLPMVNGEDGQKLSKRHGAVSVTEYREAGYLPEALFNFLGLLGWAPGGDREIVSKETMIEEFDVARCKKHAAQFGHQKLRWMNHEYVKALPVRELGDMLRPFIEKAGLTFPSEEYYLKLVELHRERIKLLADFTEQVGYFAGDDFVYDEKSVKKVLKKEGAVAVLERVIEEGLDFSSHDSLEASARGIAEELEVGFGKVAQPIRVALSGTHVSAPLFDILTLLGEVKSMARIRGTLEKLKTGEL